MNHIRRTLAALVTFTGAMLALTAASPAAFASRVPPPGGTSGPPQVHTIVVGGMPGWQITLIAAAAALATAALAVLLDRTRTARKTHATSA
jgi:ribose/xylose/arabinose/galactoside ABC-type transport system permease subunit